jgi:hypothetical protein
VKQVVEKNADQALRLLDANAEVTLLIRNRCRGNLLIRNTIHPQPALALRLLDANAEVVRVCERECVCGRECAREFVSVCERECVSVCERVCVSVCERECVSVCEWVCVNVRECARESV